MGAMETILGTLQEGSIRALRMLAIARRSTPKTFYIPTFETNAVSPIMKTEPKKNKTELFRSNFWQKNRAKTEHLNPKNRAKRIFLLTASQAQQKSLNIFQGVIGVLLKLLFLS